MCEVRTSFHSLIPRSHPLTKKRVTIECFLSLHNVALACIQYLHGYSVMWPVQNCTAELAQQESTQLSSCGAWAQDYPFPASTFCLYWITPMFEQLPFFCHSLGHIKHRFLLFIAIDARNSIQQHSMHDHLGFCIACPLVLYSIWLTL